jgi:hypothetical protein
MTPLTKLVLRRLFAIIIASILFVGWFWIVGRFARYFGAPFQGSGAAVNSNSTLWSICWETAELGFGIVLSSLALALLWDVRPPRRRLLIPLLIFLALLTTVSALNYADLDHVLGHSTQSGINLICALFGLFVTALLMNWIPLGIFPRILKALALFFLLFGVVLLPLALSLAFWLYRIRVFTTKKQADDFGAGLLSAALPAVLALIIPILVRRYLELTRPPKKPFPAARLFQNGPRRQEPLRGAPSAPSRLLRAVLNKTLCS